jgi:hypothetical protein
MPLREGHWREGELGDGYWGEGHWGQGHWGEGHQRVGHEGDCHHLPIRSAAADPHQHPRGFWLPQLLAKLAPPGEAFVASRAPNAPAHHGDESPEFMV